MSEGSMIDLVHYRNCPPCCDRLCRNELHLKSLPPRYKVTRASNPDQDTALSSLRSIPQVLQRALLMANHCDKACYLLQGVLQMLVGQSKPRSTTPALKMWELMNHSYSQRLCQVDCSHSSATIRTRHGGSPAHRPHVS